MALVSPRSDRAPILSARSFKHTRILRGVGTSMTPDVRHAFHIPGCALSARADPRQRSNLGLFCPPAPNRSKWRRSGRYRLQDAVRGARSSLCSSYGQALRRFTCWLNALAKLGNGGGKLRRRLSSGFGTSEPSARKRSWLTMTVLRSVFTVLLLAAASADAQADLLLLLQSKRLRCVYPAV